MIENMFARMSREYNARFKCISCKKDVRLDNLGYETFESGTIICGPCFYRENPHPNPIKSTTNLKLSQSKK